MRVPGLHYLTVGKVLPGDSLHLLTDSTVDGGLGSLWRCLEEKTEWNQQSPLKDIRVCGGGGIRESGGVRERDKEEREGGGEERERERTEENKPHRLTSSLL